MTKPIIAVLMAAQMMFNAAPLAIAVSTDAGSDMRPVMVALVKAAKKPSREEVMAQFTVEERHALAKLLWGEARGIPSDTEKAAVIWCVLNRVDSEDPYYPDTILGVVKQPGQFAGYNPKHPVDEHLLWLVDDVLYRWATDGEGRVLPKEYLFFASKASENYAHNYFRKLFKDPDPRWDWSLPSPYET